MYAAHLLDRSNPPQMPGQRADDQRVYANARILSDTWNEEARTLDVTFTTGSSVLRFDYREWEYFYEDLEVTDEAVDLGRLNAGGAVLNTHYQYDLNDQFGVVERAWIENGVGHATVRLSDAPGDADIVRKIATKIIRNISVGYMVHEWRIVQKDGEITRKTAVRWEPTEISFVPVPADPGCQSRAAQFTEALNARREEEARNARNEEQNTMTTPTAPSPAPADDSAARAEAAQAERTRVNTIITLGRTHSVADATVDSAINDGTSVDAFRGIVLDGISAAARQHDAGAEQQERTMPTPGLRGGANRVNDLSPATVRTLRADAMAASVRGVDVTDERANQYRQNAEMGVYGFHALARDCALELGIPVQGRNAIALINEVTRSGFGLHTSADFAGITGMTAEAVLLSTYADLQSELTNYQEYSTVQRVRDFKAVRMATMGSFSSMELIPENGRLPGVTASVQVARAAVSDYGLKFGITRQAMYNDDVGALMDSPRQIAANMRDDEQIIAIRHLTEGQIFLESQDNPNVVAATAMFGASNTVTASELGGKTGALALARAALRDQRAPGSDRLTNYEGKILIVSSDLEDEALRVMSPVYAATTGEVNVNVDANGRPRYRVVVDSRLPDGTAYLFALPARAPVVKVLRLQGQEGPAVFQLPTDDNLGLTWGAIDPIGFAFGQRPGVVKIVIQ